MQNYLIDAANRRWNIRRTCVDTPGRAYALRLIDDIDDDSPLAHLGIGFYCESIDDARIMLAGA
jgi:hypothetical protein